MAATAERIILASASVARAGLLRSAGIDFTIEPANIDERAFKQDARRKGWSALECAAGLATYKAMWVSGSFNGQLVIGADQLLATGDEWFDKPGDLIEARRQLSRLRGRSHILATAVCVARDGDPLWHATSTPELTMRHFSDAFLEEYIAADGEALLGSVGAYRLEGRGVQLFSGVSGDYFAVIGLPLVELLGYLRERGVVPK
jgi:septum formation protein